jgi:hypothetical protein
MGLMRLGLSNPAANTDVAIYTATGPFLASIIATNKSASVTSNVRMWIVPSGATLTSQYAYLAYDQDLVPQNTLETHRFALNQNDVVYVRADTADMSFMINGLKQVDIALAAGVTSYSNTPPLDVMDGMIWVDKDGNGSTVSDAFLKQTSSTSSGEASTVNINTKPWNIPWGIQKYVTSYSNDFTGSIVNGITTSHTFVNGRRYKITAHASTAVAGGRQFAVINAGIGSQRVQDSLPAGFPHWHGDLIVTGNGTTQNVTFSFAIISGSMNLAADSGANSHYLVIEDIGIL